MGRGRRSEERGETLVVAIYGSSSKEKSGESQKDGNTTSTPRRNVAGVPSTSSPFILISMVS